MKIIATLSDSEGRCLGRAVGIGNNELEAVQAVFHSGGAFAEMSVRKALVESIKNVFSEATPYCLEANYERDGWAVHIFW